ncbi:hypothetical protein BU17DRAFT_45337 [Hysterangium stoloniferum]|nr:hypothetical protein BU17DRAFT_45337 [Hysterangium stoloniferum]
MALTTRTINPFNNPSKATRQQIPPFLSKLFHMVNDPQTDNLIRWSDAGDSFYVHDHERFAKEVLPHWFKHGNFGSFVRQLNNYGFHKVPHLQQGVLRSDGEAEISHFENQYFQRGQSDLLCLIQRKKQGANDTREDSPDMKEPVAGLSTVSNGAESESSHTSHNVKGAVIDINGLVNGIQAIKRHQHAISAELKELHQSNQALWQEAYAARERHKKHHDTITRILKFLAGVFGQTAGSPRAQEVPHDDSEGGGNSSAVMSRRPPRLMIENGVDAGEKATEVLNGMHLNLNEFMEPLDFEGGQANDGVLSPAPFVTTPAPSPSVTVTPKADQISVSELSSKETLLNRYNSPNAVSTSTQQSSTTSPAKSKYTPTNHSRLPSTDISQMYNNFTIANSTNTSALAPSAPNGMQPDLNVQSAFSTIINNPAQLQRVIAALQSQLPMSLPPDLGPEPSNLPHDGLDLSIPPAPDMSSFCPPPDGQLSPGSTLSLLSMASGLPGPPTVAPGDDTTALNALAHSSNQLRKSYKDAADVEADVNTVESHIDSLMKSLGLDPNMNAVLRGEQDEEIVNSSGEQPQPPNLSDLPEATQDFDFESFLTQEFDPNSGMVNFDVGNAEQNAEQIGAFLDEVRSVSGGSDATVESDMGEGAERSGGTGVRRKRKSEVEEDLTSKKVKKR